MSKKSVPTSRRLFDFAFGGRGWYNWDAQTQSQTHPHGPAELRAYKYGIRVLLYSGIACLLEHGYEEPASPREVHGWDWSYNELDLSDNIIAWTYDE